MELPVSDVLSPAWLRWLADHGAGYVVAATWIWTLLRERTALRTQSEKLSDRLCQVLEGASVERARLSDEYRSGHDWIVNTLLAQFTELATRRESSARGTPPPTPPPRESSPVSGSTPLEPPPLPPVKPSRATAPIPLPPPPAPKRPTRRTT